MSVKEGTEHELNRREESTPGRRIEIPSVPNLRDVGGYPVPAAAGCAPGCCIASVELNQLQGDDLDTFAELRDPHGVRLPDVLRGYRKRSTGRRCSIARPERTAPAGPLRRRGFFSACPPTTSHMTTSSATATCCLHSSRCSNTSGPPAATRTCSTPSSARAPTRAGWFVRRDASSRDRRTGS